MALSRKRPTSSRQSLCSTTLLTMPTPGAAFIVTDTLPNMMYHREVSCGESPDCRTLKPTPLEPYVGLDWGVKLSEAPCVKSMFTVLPNAESAGHPCCVRGLQFVYVCATDGTARSSVLATPSNPCIDGNIVRNVWRMRAVLGVVSFSTTLK